VKIHLKQEILIESNPYLVYSELLSLSINAVKSAGDVILSVYKNVEAYKVKNDGSPLTIADESSHQILYKILSESDLEIISEEGTELINRGNLYWIIDPLDGTKDFLAQNDEFVINIALIENNYPVLGIQYAPALDELYFASPSIGAWFDNGIVRKKIEPVSNHEIKKMAVSRFHNSNESKNFKLMNNIQETVQIGSSLKLSRIARSLVDVYPRFVGTSEWDTAAGQAILETVGGKIIDLQTKKRLKYGKSGRRNQEFIAFRKPLRFDQFIF
jgi:3'(2'), 5'-bisphosphate nucleotidase